MRRWLRVSMEEITPQIVADFGLQKQEGTLIVEVSPNSPAAKAELRRG